jgi:hypothetical protein
MILDEERVKRSKPAQWRTESHLEEN